MPRVRTELSSGPSVVEYLHTGSGEGVVLVHGTGATPDGNFGHLIDVLRPRHTVVAPFLSGAGTTTDTGAPLTVGDLARQVTAAADDAGLTEFHLVGHSLGACVAAAAAATSGDRVRSLVLHAGWATSDTRMAAQFALWRRLLAADTGLLARMVLLTAFRATAPHFRDPAAFEREVAAFAAMFRPEGTARQLRLDEEVDIAPLLPRVTAPSLVVAGTDDTVVPPYHQERMAELIPGARLTHVAGGHAFPFEAPERFAELVAGFIASRRPQRTPRPQLPDAVLPF
ncbi:alpha/beta fold hydrolase [Streptomyces sp. WELS2]|uniref:alpha/beta fold hydrolase n=1 Tax=Streptomyces sp. WELS2 TaxID=2749435 RepID=UPI0015F020C2|nr:alpha/beta hydrolase [Streptomyces sp. WELS2]